MSDQDLYQVIKTAVGSLKVYPILAAKNAVAPFLVYERTNTNRDRALSGETGRIEAGYRIDIYAPTLSAAQSLADDLATSFSSTSTSTIRFISIENEQNASDLSGDPALYRWIMEVSVSFNTI